jgi:hypothetical protein
MARDPARIDRILWLLTTYWRAHPDLRLGQIVGNCTPRVRTSVGGAEPGDPYYVEDDVIEAALRGACKPVTNG